jgi:hypothetical protein
MPPRRSELSNTCYRLRRRKGIPLDAPYLISVVRERDLARYRLRAAAPGERHLVGLGARCRAPVAERRGRR